MHTWAFHQNTTGVYWLHPNHLKVLRATVLADQERPHSPPGPLYPQGLSESHSTVDDTWSMKDQTDHTDLEQAACRRSD